VPAATRTGRCRRAGNRAGWPGAGPPEG
jgi:hypothetical protein